MAPMVTSPHHPRPVDRSDRVSAASAALVFSLFCSVVFLPVAARAASYLVLPDGSGQFPTIQQALDAAEDGDVIELGYGRFTGAGNRDIRYRGKAVTIRSQSGHPETCILDCEGSPDDMHRGFVFDGEGPESVLQGVTILNGNVDGPGGDLPGCGGGGILFLGEARPTLRNVTIRHCGAMAAGGVLIWSGSPRFTGCRFVDNAACGGGGGYCFAGSPEFTDCVFEANVPLQSGGGFNLNGATLGTFTNCVFRNNLCQHCGWGAGINVLNSAAVIEGCTFVGNRSYGEEWREGSRTGCAIWEGGSTGSPDREGGEDWCVGGAIGVSGGQVTISDCTFVANDALAGAAVGIDTWQSSPSVVAIRNSILVFGRAGGAVTCGLPGDEISIECSDIYGNVGGDWEGCIAHLAGLDGNLSLDPLFCDVSGDDLSLRSDSPCAPEHSDGCGLIGAEPVGCDASTVPSPGQEDCARRASMLRAFPNPVTDACLLQVCGDAGVHRGIRIVDVSGRVVRDLGLAADRWEEGCLEMEWDLRDGFGHRVPAGIYFAKIGATTRALVVGR